MPAVSFCNASTAIFWGASVAFSSFTCLVGITSSKVSGTSCSWVSSALIISWGLVIWIISWRCCVCWGLCSGVLRLGGCSSSRWLSFLWWIFRGWERRELIDTVFVSFCLWGWWWLMALRILRDCRGGKGCSCCCLDCWGRGVSRRGVTWAVSVFSPQDRGFLPCTDRLRTSCYHLTPYSPLSWRFPLPASPWTPSETNSPTVAEHSTAYSGRIKTDGPVLLWSLHSPNPHSNTTVPSYRPWSRSISQ